MKDVAALCERVVVVTGGTILYDGSLEQIVDQFTSHKVVTLDLESPPAAGQIERWVLVRSQWSSCLLAN